MAQRWLWFGFLILTIVALADTNTEATAAIDRAKEIADNAQMIATTGSYDVPLKGNGIKKGSEQGETQPDLPAQVPVPADRPTLQELKQQYESEDIEIKELGDAKTESSHDLRTQPTEKIAKNADRAFLSPQGPQGGDAREDDQEVGEALGGTWTAHASKNCNRNGATSIGGPLGRMSVDSCKAKCLDRAGCDCIQMWKGKCYLLKDCFINSCANGGNRGTAYTYVAQEPTPAPTEEPTPAPTEEPTPAPTEEPTPAPTEEPTPAPTEEPTPAPTEEPTPAPTEEPTPAPTEGAGNCPDESVMTCVPKHGWPLVSNAVQSASQALQVQSQSTIKELSEKVKTVNEQKDELTEKVEQLNDQKGKSKDDSEQSINEAQQKLKASKQNAASAHQKAAKTEVAEKAAVTSTEKQAASAEAKLAAMKEKEADSKKTAAEKVAELTEKMAKNADGQATDEKGTKQNIQEGQSKNNELTEKVKTCSEKKVAQDKDVPALAATMLKSIGTSASRSNTKEAGSCKDPPELGWARQKEDGSIGEWEKDAWSCNKPVGFDGFTSHSEQYQVSRPGCPAVCKPRGASTAPALDWAKKSCSASGGKAATSSLEALKAGTAASVKQQGKISAMVSCGQMFICALPDSGHANCFGNDRHKQVSGLKPWAKTRFQLVSAGDDHICGVEDGGGESRGGRVRCWGSDEYKQVSGVPTESGKDIRFLSVSAGGMHTCGVTAADGGEKQGGPIRCWGDDKHKQASGVPKESGKDVHFLSVSAGYWHTCAVEDGGGASRGGPVRCWGWAHEAVSGVPKESGKDVHFLSVSAGRYHTCGVEDGGGESRGGRVRCWGWDRYEAVSGVPKESGKDVHFLSLSAGVETTCGVVKDGGSVKCWGYDGTKVVSGVPTGVQFRSVSFRGGGLACGLEKDTAQLHCWGEFIDGWLRAGTTIIPLKMVMEPSCATEHPEKEGPVACTSCKQGMHHTIIDPRTNTGTCTKVECPFCKPRSCCGARHKHYVVNTESLEGVCVRHNDDCTPVCVPVGDEHPEKRRVCSKGCNQLVKVTKATKHTTMGGGDSSSEADKFNLMVCRADKRVICAGRKKAANDKGDQVEQSECAQEKTVQPVAICNFSVDLWNLGGTCIANHLHNEKYPQCPEKSDTAVEAIASQCRKATEVDYDLCKKNPSDSICKKAAQERDYCTRLAMSF